ncbi:N-acetylglucosaminyl-phosphatidylinositol de-N-acetylase [Smittium culicis]|uniref:N-acetylglucosaminylphosphatidylinositol deacetylase n=1 Tax=Smittium culicis TaxID=133412 RepID=A0A1R1YB85_9FUNG|nr:N-acetylglucosaminyl-phosphatidylinositol de-N-acetylase [Smittium culicis]
MIKTGIKFKFQPVALFTLDSVSILRKYLFFLDALFSYSEYLHNSMTNRPTGTKDKRSGGNKAMFVADMADYRLGCKSMSYHESQLVWYRKFYVIFSRYMYINTYDQIA